MNAPIQSPPHLNWALRKSFARLNGSNHFLDFHVAALSPHIALIGEAETYNIQSRRIRRAGGVVFIPTAKLAKFAYRRRNTHATLVETIPAASLGAAIDDAIRHIEALALDPPAVPDLDRWLMNMGHDPLHTGERGHEHAGPLGDIVHKYIAELSCGINMLTDFMKSGNFTDIFAHIEACAARRNICACIAAVTPLLDYEMQFDTSHPAYRRARALAIWGGYLANQFGGTCGYSDAAIAFLSRANSDWPYT